MRGTQADQRREGNACGDRKATLKKPSCPERWLHCAPEAGSNSVRFLGMVQPMRGARAWLQPRAFGARYFGFALLVGPSRGIRQVVYGIGLQAGMSSSSPQGGSDALFMTGKVGRGSIARWRCPC